MTSSVLARRLLDTDFLAPALPAAPLDRRSPGTAHAAAATSDAVAAPADDPLAVATFVASVRHLPLFSGTAMQVVRTIGRDDVTIRDLTRLIGADAALVAHLLRIVNSPFYGLARRVGSVGDALAVLGFDRARRMITASIIQRPLMTYLHDSDTVRAFWRHELACAALARHLASRRGADAEVAYMAGLMHGVGRLAMLTQFPEHIELLLRVEADDEQRGADLERAQFGFDHAQVGGALLALWGLPVDIVRAAERHEDAFEPDDGIDASVWRATRLAHALLEPADDECPWMAEVGLDAAARRRIVDEIAALESGQD